MSSDKLSREKSLLKSLVRTPSSIQTHHQNRGIIVIVQYIISINNKNKYQTSLTLWAVYG